MDISQILKRAKMEIMILIILVVTAFMLPVHCERCTVYLRSKTSPSFYLERDDTWVPYLNPLKNRTWDIVPGLHRGPSDQNNVVSFRLQADADKGDYYICSAKDMIALCREYPDNTLSLTFGLTHITSLSDKKSQFRVVSASSQYMNIKDNSVYVWLGKDPVEWIAEIVTGCFGLLRPDGVEKPPPTTAQPTTKTKARTTTLPTTTVPTTSSYTSSVFITTTEDPCESIEEESVQECLDEENMNSTALKRLMEKHIENIPTVFEEMKNLVDSKINGSSDGEKMRMEQSRKILEVAEKLEKTGIMVAAKLTKDKMFHVTTSTLVFEARRQKLPFKFPSEPQENGNNLMVSGKGNDTYVPAVGFLYTDIHMNMDNEVEVEEGLKSGLNQNQSYVLNSQVISASVDAVIESVTITLAHVNRTTKDIICAFWNSSQTVPCSTDVGLWSTKGCTKNTMLSNENRTVCTCNHLTNFALLMAVRDVPIAEKHRIALKTITIVCSALSLTCLIIGIALFVFIMLGEKRHTRHILHLNLMIALALAQFIFVTGIEANEYRAVCQTVAYLLHYFLMASFGWMLVEGLYLYFLIVKVFNDGESKIWHYFAIAWGVPALIVLVTGASAHSKYGNEDYCWFAAQGAAIWACIGPVLAVIVINTIILAMIISQIVRLAHKPGKFEHVKVGVRSSFILLPLLGVTWIFGILSFNSETIIFQYIFATCNSLQGFLIALMHCFCNTEVRNLLRRRLEVVRHTSSLTRNMYSFRKSDASTNSKAGYDSSRYTQYTVTYNDPNSCDNHAERV